MKTNIFLPEICTFVQNAFIQWSRITVVHIHAYVWGVSSKIHPACHSDAIGIKPGSNQNMTDKNAAEY